MLNSTTSDVRLFLIDEQKLILEAMRSLIQSEPGVTCIGQATNQAQALEVGRYKPDIILLGLCLTGQNSLAFLSDLLRSAGNARVLIITETTDPEFHLQAFRLGAMGVLQKTEPASDLFKAIHKIHHGDVWFSRPALSAVVSQFGVFRKPEPEASRIATITMREREVIGLICQGRKNKQIAEQLFISEKTVGHHLTSIFAKLEVSDRLELLVYSYRHGLADVAALSADV
jgi:DNA-binding NarL/FixJ family response regulator